MQPLTEADKHKLIKFQERGIVGAYVLLGIIVVGAAAMTYGFLFLPGATWPYVVIPFLLLMIFGLLMSLRERGKAKHDLQAGMKERVEGVVSKKRISQGNQTIDYDSNTLLLMAKRVEEEENGKPITRYGALDAEINSGSRYWYGVLIGKENFNVGVRFYVQIQEGDSLQLEIAPKSRIVLNVKLV
ncbi:MAG TPA: hypothetical protein DHV26_09650 [Cytophagales bacterium]|nr:hypothetical protein [Cytophagales bacterium]HRG09726.1 hypothetical protein [Cyclobacteriaceae bacterium]